MTLMQTSPRILLVTNMEMQQRFAEISSLAVETSRAALLPRVAISEVPCEETLLKSTTK